MLFAFGCLDVSVKFFHNDAPGLVCAPHLVEIGINLFNFSSDHGLAQMKKLAGDKVTLLGNIPPERRFGCGDSRNRWQKRWRQC